MYSRYITCGRCNPVHCSSIFSAVNPLYFPPCPRSHNSSIRSPTSSVCLSSSHAYISLSSHKHVLAFQLQFPFCIILMYQNLLHNTKNPLHCGFDICVFSVILKMTHDILTYLQSKYFRIPPSCSSV